MKDKDADLLAEHLDQIGYEDRVVDALLDALPYEPLGFDHTPYFWHNAVGEKADLHSNEHSIEQRGWYRLEKDVSCGWNLPGEWHTPTAGENGLGYYQPATGKWVKTAEEAV